MRSYNVKFSFATMLLSVALIVILLSSCKDLNTPDYSNPHDPNSKKFRPNAPTEVMVTYVKEDMRILMWRDNSGFENGFRIERKLKNNDTYDLLAVVPPNTFLYTDSSFISTDTIYYYRISAESKDGIINSSDSVACSLSFSPPLEVFMTCLTSSSIKLEWQDKCDFEKGFRIEVSVNNQPFTELSDLPTNSNSFIITALSSANNYRFRIYAYTDINRSHFSNELPISYVSQSIQYLYSRKVSFDNTAVYDVDVSVDGRFIACGSSGLTILRVGDGTVIKKIPEVYQNLRVLALAYSKDGNLLGAGRGSYIDLFDTKNYNKITSFHDDRGDEIGKITFTATGDTLAATSGYGSILLFNVRNKSHLATYANFDFGNKTLDISPDGKYLATGGNDLLILKVKDGTLVKSYPSFGGYYGSAVYNPKGSIMASISQIVTNIRFWDVNTDRLIQEIPEKQMRYLRYNISGDLLIGSGREDCVVNIWEPETNSLFATFNNITPSFSVAFSPLNNIIVTGDKQGTIRVWAMSGAWKIDMQ